MGKLFKLQKQIWSALETTPGRLQGKRIIAVLISLEIFNFFCHRVQKHHQDQTAQTLHFLREFSGWCFTCFHWFSNCESTESMGFLRVGSYKGQTLSHQTSNSAFLYVLWSEYSHFSPSSLIYVLTSFCTQFLLYNRGASLLQLYCGSRVGVINNNSSSANGS